MLELRGVKRIQDPEPLRLEFGGGLDSLEIVYETWGRLSAKADNAVLICPSFSSHSHARSHPGNPDPGWWEEMIGPGRALDTDRWFVLCPSLLGGCHGTTGPLSMNPRTGSPWAGDFPVISIRDIVNVQIRLLNFLGIESVHAAVGGSMGAMEVIELAVCHPARIARALALSGTAKTQAYTSTIRFAGRQAIMQDPAFKDGHYGSEIPRQGLKLARAVGTIFYRSREDFNRRFSCEPVGSPSVGGFNFDYQSYLDHMGNKILHTFDANSYLRLSLSMDLHDVTRGFGSLERALEKVEASFLVMGVRQDPLIPVDEQLSFHEALCASGKNSEWHELVSHFGHDAFLKEFDWLTPRIQKFLA